MNGSGPFTVLGTKIVVYSLTPSRMAIIVLVSANRLAIGSIARAGTHTGATIARAIASMDRRRKVGRFMRVHPLEVGVSWYPTPDNDGGQKDSHVSGVSSC